MVEAQCSGGHFRKYWWGGGASAEGTSLLEGSGRMLPQKIRNLEYVSCLFLNNAILFSYVDCLL